MSQELGRTILYIEDDPGSRVLVQRTLEFAGYHVELASNGIKGIDTAKACRPSLILMDINLPDLSGREVTTRLRAIPEFKHLPIVALTAQSFAGERDKALAAGASGYLTKPIDVDLLPRQIAEFLAGRQEILPQKEMDEARAAYTQDVVSRLEAKIREVEQAYDNLKRLDKMKEAFIQLTAHELRTPLTVVYGYGKLLQESPAVAKMMQESDEVYGLMIMLLQAIDRMSAVINEILLISRVASGRIDLSIYPVSVRELIEGTMADYASAIQQRRQTARLDISRAPEKIYADRALLSLALANLVGNAIKYTPDGGTITLRAQQNGDFALISVQDTGIGIDTADQAHVFDRFYSAGDTQLHSTSKVAFRGGGLGLGLAVCAEIVRAHDGTIRVESAGRSEQHMPGSTFTISLPIKGRLASQMHDPRRAGRT